MPIFCVKSVKIYTGQKKFTRVYPWLPWQIWGMGESVFSLISSACASFWNTRHTQLFLFDGIHPIQQTTEVESGVTNVAVSVRFIHFALDRPIPPLTVRTHSQAAYSECHYHEYSLFFSLIHCIILAKLPHLNIFATKPPITPTRTCTIIGQGFS